MKKIDVLVRAIIQDKGKILVCKRVDKGYYFFPGGHLEFGESAEKALKRELKEELGLTVNKCLFIGGSEHLFIEDGKKYHEINLAFQALVKKLTTRSRENHLQFFLFNKKQLAKEKILPITLKKSILKWLKDPEGKPLVSYGAGKKPFWASQIKN
jgi:mutator protein MutT